MLVLRGTPATVDEELDPVVRGIGCRLAQGAEQISVEVGIRPVEDAARDGGSLATTVEASIGGRSVDAAVEGEDAGNWSPRAAPIAAKTTSRPATRSLRIRIAVGV